MEAVQLGVIIGIMGSVFSLIVGPIIAQGKGRTVWKALLLCFFTGWIGLLILLTLEDKKPCQACGNRIPAKAFICSYCGHDIRKEK